MITQRGVHRKAEHTVWTVEHGSPNRGQPAFIMGLAATFMNRVYTIKILYIEMNVCLFVWNLYKSTFLNRSEPNFAHVSPLVWRRS
jgi:hypothetical protein